MYRAQTERAPGYMATPCYGAFTCFSRSCTPVLLRLLLLQDHVYVLYWVSVFLKIGDGCFRSWQVKGHLGLPADPGFPSQSRAPTRSELPAGLRCLPAPSAEGLELELGVVEGGWFISSSTPFFGRANLSSSFRQTLKSADCLEKGLVRY